ncbi:Ubiquitin domain-containing protein 2 [Porphyridium purpureum]|uniref:Ubiquitin domain-containing protein 2 n=1 Tax=Porphyridium purpureum TaxID=35688 RepID=A0A5J4Z2P8_PORPP|nr:Ubiquitin domain-containing protein 2 [Porphyridium purpureum]|eukprot:POR2224..scf295_1
MGGCASSLNAESGKGKRNSGAAGRVAGVGAWDGHVRSVAPWRVEPAVTRAQLERLRNEFWETRVEGREEMWQALRAAAEADTDDLRDEIVKAAGIRPAAANATLLVAYDERGALYEVPIYCLRDPDNLDGEPACPEFKDAARAVQEYCERMKQSRAV